MAKLQTPHFKIRAMLDTALDSYGTHEVLAALVAELAERATHDTVAAEAGKCVARALHHTRPRPGIRLLAAALRDRAALQTEPSRVRLVYRADGSWDVLAAHAHVRRSDFAVDLAIPGARRPRGKNPKPWNSLALARQALDVLDIALKNP